MPLNKSDHDLLTEVIIKLDVLSTQFTNHLQHHWAVTITALSAALIGAFSLAVGITLIYLKIKGVG